VVERASLKKQDLPEYCRNKGIYPESSSNCGEKPASFLSLKAAACDYVGWMVIKRCFSSFEQTKSR
jgi:hypothetical protein